MKKYLNKIKELELELLDPITRKNKKRLNELLSDDFLEFASNGFVMNKKDILSRLPKQKQIEWKVLNLKVKELSPDVFLVAYKVKKIELKDNKKIVSLRSSIWKNIGNKCQMVFHQGTLM